MKKLLLFVSFAFSINANAQYVTIPDGNFVTYLQGLIPAAMNGNQMDTTSTLVTTTTYSINVAGNSIINLSGVQYFKSLTYLNCSNQQPGLLDNGLTNIPALPNSLTYLDCSSNNALTNLPALPNSLINLNCTYCNLDSLPVLPATLQILSCYNCGLLRLPAFPNSLIYISCGNNDAMTNPVLPTLPSSLQTLWCENDGLTSLPALPATLTYLNCFYNNITSLPVLPALLDTLICSYTLLTSLPALPNSLKYLDCNYSNISCFSSFPNSLDTLDISNNPCNCLPNYVSHMTAANLALPLCAVGNTHACAVATSCAPGLSFNMQQDTAPHTWHIYPTYTSNTTNVKWYWGDGTSTTGLYPSHTYSAAGAYNVCATAFSACGDSANYCLNNYLSRQTNNSIQSGMVYINVINSTVNTNLYQKLLADSLTEFNVSAYCPAILKQSSLQQTSSNCVSTGGYYYSNNILDAKGDSVFNSKTYKKITYNNTFQGLMREDTVAKKVYFIQYCNTNEELLYNFALQVGDTISYNFQSSSYLMSSGIYTVDSIILKHDYKNYYYKHFYLRNHASASNVPLEMIEGVGNVCNPLFLYYDFQPGMFSAPFGSCTVANFSEAVSCKSNNSIKVYFDSCAYTMSYLQSHGNIIDSCHYCFGGGGGGINKLEAKENISIYPNPAQNSFTIETNSNEKQMIFVFDVNGKLVLNQFIQNKTTIDASILNAGVYSVNITNNEGTQTKKLVIVK